MITSLKINCYKNLENRQKVSAIKYNIHDKNGAMYPNMNENTSRQGRKRILMRKAN